MSLVNGVTKFTGVVNGFEKRWELVQYQHMAPPFYELEFVSGFPSLKNETVDFVVTTDGKFAYDSTGLTADITSVVPEPATIIAGALMLLPFGASALRILRRNCGII